MLFEELVVEQLKEKDPLAWARLMRKKGLDARVNGEESRGQEEDEVTGSNGAAGSVEPDEGRPIRVPSAPYVPTARERREHNGTHYPHRTWSECCMAGRAIAGAHGRSQDEINPNAGELHFDYCFLTK